MEDKNEEPVEKKDCIYKSTLHIYLDEKDNRTNEHLLLKPNGFTEPTVIKDFPVRNRNLILHVRRRRYLDENGKNVILNLYPTTAEGTRYSEEFAVFLKDTASFNVLLRIFNTFVAVSTKVIAQMGAKLN